MTETVALPTTRKPNRMDRRREKTRQLLMSAAIELILEKGIEETTADAITETADVGRRTFYNHFDNKKGCIKAAVGERFSHYASESTRIGEEHEDQAVALSISAMAVFEHISSDPITQYFVTHPRLLIDAIRESQREFMISTLLRGFESKRFNTSLPTEALEAIVSWGFVGLILENNTPEKENNRSSVWAEFLLRNLGIAEEEISLIISTARAHLLGH